MSGLELWWLAQSGFRLRDRAGGPVLFVDPFLSPHQGSSWELRLSPEDMVRQTDFVLGRHPHIDHFDQPALKVTAATPDCPFRRVVPRPSVQLAVDLGIPRKWAIGAEPKGSLDFTDVRIHPVSCRHRVDLSHAYTSGEQLSHGLVRYVGYSWSRAASRYRLTRVGTRGSGSSESWACCRAGPQGRQASVRLQRFGGQYIVRVENGESVIETPTRFVRFEVDHCPGQQRPRGWRSVPAPARGPLIAGTSPGSRAK